VIGEFVGGHFHVALQPGADGLPDAADREVCRCRHMLIRRCPQHVHHMLAGYERKQRAGLGPFPHHHSVGEFGAEHQTADTGVLRDRVHHDRHPGTGLVICRSRSRGGLHVGGEFGDHPVIDVLDQLVFVAEALVEIAGRQAGALADAADRQLRVIGRAEQVQSCLQ